MPRPNPQRKASLFRTAPPPPPAPGAHCWSSSRGRIALATAMLMEVVTHGKEQFSFQKRSFIGGRENCQLSTPVCPALFWCWDMCPWERWSLYWVISWWFWLPLSLMPLRSQAWNPSAVFILATQQCPLIQLLQVLQSVYVTHVPSSLFTPVDYRVLALKSEFIKQKSYIRMHILKMRKLMPR